MKVAVYSTKTCPYCVQVKQWLTDRDIAFKDLQIDTDKQAMKTMIEVSGQMSVPYTLVESDDIKQGVIGYDETRLQALLGVSSS